MRNYPDKFVVKDSSNGFKWNVVHQLESNLYHFQGDGNASGGFHSAHDMDNWQEDQNNSYEFIFPEPELVFPFTFRTDYPNEENGTYVAIESVNDDSRIELHSKFGIGDISKEVGKKFIKDGKWIVESVGYSTDRYELSDAEGSYNEFATENVAKAPSSPSKDISTLTIKVDATQATEAMKAFAASVEEVNIALESMQKIMAEIGLTQQAVSVSCWDDFKIGEFNV